MYRLFLRSHLVCIRFSAHPTQRIVGAGQISKKRGMATKTIGTHNGTFHCDEALAVFLLRHTSTYRDAALERTRDPAVLDKCDIVVDVGSVYDPQKNRFDHHQRGFQEAFGHGFTTKLSSAGLVYKHFGKQIIASEVKLDAEHPQVAVLWLKLYKEFIEAIDAVDNGISQYSAEEKPRYRNRTDLSSRVGWLNPAWNVPVDAQAVDSLFVKASQLAGEEFFGRLRYYAQAWLPARDIVKASLSTRHQVYTSGEILLFEQFVPWKEHLFELEEEHGISREALPLYVIYPDEFGGNWRIQAVPVSPESFESRKALPEAWRGLRDDELSRVSGVEGCIFVHASGFIGGNKTKEGAFRLAILAVTM
ncbi:hypothetical protein SCLCIDRAFT_354334 [Scleroderma citrinum Foug A]|uniref:Metal-dependent protein hydrolase n=1 Tax=Scleroderma citrinum Foug A TaxID=1036808 RepID=A0A0C3E074_9AGAM|nr:hypothetical protein SCLCIDRAFT_354334 [Scleroderma citrinum Foug A]